MVHSEKESLFILFETLYVDIDKLIEAVRKGCIFSFGLTIKGVEAM